MRPQAEVNAQRKASRVRRLTRICEQCGVTFLMSEPGSKARAREARAGRYCSRRCWAVGFAEEAGRRAAESAARRRIIHMLDRRAECPICLAVFSKVGSAKYCSDACRAENARRRQVLACDSDRTPRPCSECGVVFAPAHGNKRRKYCSIECSRRHWKRIDRRAERARLRAAIIERVDPTAVFKRDGWRCHICGGKTLKSKRGSTHPRAPELDHITPLAAGGEHSYQNTACACRECNHRKSDGPGGQLLMFGLPA
ncbi:MAG: HNH endonuclease [Thalassobaculum sp.]